jgi:hypothetical protein
MTKKVAFQAWFEREFETFMARPGATEAGFFAHLMELLKNNPDLARQMCDDFVRLMLREMRH